MLHDRSFAPAAPYWLAVACLAAACGKTGPPFPPEPRGPVAPGAIEVRQVGEQVEVAFTIPGPRGPRPDQQPVRAELLRLEYQHPLSPPADPDAFVRRGTLIAVEDGAFAPQSRVTLTDPTLSTLEGGPVGWLVRYAVRLRDARGRPSPLAAASDLVLARPQGFPTDLRAENTPAGIHLSWTVPAGEGPYTFNLYRAAADDPFLPVPLNPQPLPTPEYLDASATLGTTYRYRVRTSVVAGLPYHESLSSPVVEILAQDRFPPSAPTDVIAVPEAGGVRLFWQPSPERDVSGYRVHRSEENGPWAMIAADVFQPLYLDVTPPGERTLSYRVTSFDRAEPPNESVPSEPAEVVFAGAPEAPPEGSGP